MNSAFRFLIPLCFLVGVGCADSDAVISGSLSTDSFGVSQEMTFEEEAWAYCHEVSLHSEESACELTAEVAQVQR